MLFVGYQYFDAQWRWRIERTLDYSMNVPSAHLNSPPMAEMDLETSECKSRINAFIESDLDERYGNQWRQELSSEGYFLTEWGKISRYNGTIYYSDKERDGAYYFYGFPRSLSKFFYYAPEDRKEMCNKIIDSYESALHDVLEILHEATHSYAGLSICTTSGLCDSFLACQSFVGVISNFVSKWQKYFELWAAKHRDYRYTTLQMFISHCFSNSLLVDYSEGRMQFHDHLMLYVQRFSNVW